VDSGIAAWMECVTVNIIWKILHGSWTLVLQLASSALQWTLCGSYFTAGGQCYCSLNGLRYSEQCVEDTAQQVDSGIAAWMKCVNVNIIWSVWTRKKTTCYEMCNILTILILSGKNWQQVFPLRQCNVKVSTWNCALWWEHISAGRLVTGCNWYIAEL